MEVSSWQISPEMNLAAIIGVFVKSYLGFMYQKSVFTKVWVPTTKEGKKID